MPVSVRGGAPTEGHAQPKTTVKTRGSKRPPPHPKNQRKFWAVLIYSRVMSWGRDFANVSKYIVQNTLEETWGKAIWNSQAEELCP